MENTENLAWRNVEYKNRVYTIVPEITSKSCNGCDLQNKQCYKDKSILEVCRQGYIFVKSENAIDYMKKYNQTNKATL